MTDNTCPNCQEHAQEATRAINVIAEALAALNAGRIGDVRKILRTGKAAPLISITSVKARDR